MNCRTIIHLSDLHFGRTDPATLEPIVEAIGRLKPDVVAISGDLTQRARTSEFLQARDFLQRLPEPRIVVPGNHDVPLHNPYARFVTALDKFREYITSNREPVFADDAIAVVGVNTARSLTWKGGRLSRAQIEMVRSSFCSYPASVCRVLVAHHPLDVPGDWAISNQVGRARFAFEQWAECGVDVILAGHAHRAFAGGSAARLRIGTHKAVVVQAGTATSTRGRGEPNSFNIVQITPEEILVERMTYESAARAFRSSHCDRFRRL